MADHPDSVSTTTAPTTSTLPRIFISYSRREFYFAESLSIRLQYSGLSVWFDSQQIALGENWSQDIEEGLSGSGILVLVASQASIASPYVAKEWQHALENGKPIHIIYFEAVDLPPELAASAVSIIDGRGGFEAIYPRLLACVKGETAIHDPSPAKGRLGLPTKLAPALRTLVMSRIWLSVVYSWVILAEVFALAQTIPSLNPYLFLLAGIGLLAILVIRPGWTLWQILRRNFVHTQVIGLTAYGAILLTGMLVFAELNDSQIPKPVSLVSVAVMATYLRYWLQVGPQAKWSIDLLNWYPLSAQPPSEWRAIVQRPYLNPELDIQINAPVMSGEEPLYPRLAKPAEPKPVQREPGARWFQIKIEQTKPEPAAHTVITSSHSTLKGASYYVYYVPADTWLANTFKQSLERFGLKAAPEAEKADYKMLYLSYRTSKAFAYELSEKHPDLICILGESIKMPADSPGSFQGIQWFDYRGRQDNRLYAALDALRDNSESMRAVEALNTLPPQLNTYTRIPELQVIWYAFSFLGMGCLALGLTGAAFIAGIIAVGTLNSQLLLAFLSVLVLFATAVFFYRAAWRAATYQSIHRTLVWFGTLGGLALVIGVPWLSASISPIPTFISTVITLFIVCLAWLPLAVTAGYWGRQLRLPSDTDAFGAPALHLSLKWIMIQVVGLVLAIFLLNTLWTGKPAFADFLSALLVGR
jgi:hypothetical protein